MILINQGKMMEVLKITIWMVSVTKPPQLSLKTLSGSSLE